MRILLIDDEPLILKSYGRHLHRNGGHDVITASSGAEALAQLEADQDFDFIFCDLSMPGISGIEVHRAVREFHVELVNRFAFLTGGISSAATEDYLRSTDVRVLTKPIRMSEFEKTLSEVGRGEGSR